MDDLADDHLFLDLIESVALDILARIGGDPNARYAFFKQFVELAQQGVGPRATAVQCLIVGSSTALPIAGILVL